MLVTHLKLFYKTRRGLELFSLAHFQHDFLRKIFILLYLIYWPSFIVLLSVCLIISVFGDHKEWQTILVELITPSDLFKYQASVLLRGQLSTEKKFSWGGLLCFLSKKDFVKRNRALSTQFEMLTLASFSQTTN